jgi:hypothetical protein
MRPSRLTGLVVGVAILTGVVTWSVSQVATDSPASGTSKSEAVSTSGAAAQAYVDGVVALSPEQRAALYGTLAQSEPYVGSLNALRPETQAELRRAADLAATADWARAEGLTGLSPASLKPSAAPSATIADWARAEGLTGLSPASLKPSTTLHADAIAALPNDQLVAMFGNVG